MRRTKKKALKKKALKTKATKKKATNKKLKKGKARKRAANGAAKKTAPTKSARPGPGEYVADPTESVTRPEDLPEPEIVTRSLSYKKCPCPKCGYKAYRDGQRNRSLHDLGDTATGRPREVHLTYSIHHCSRCGAYFHADISDIAPPNAQYTRRVIETAVRLVAEDGLPYRPASWHMWRDHRVFVPFATIQNWVEASGKKSGRARAG